MHNKFLNLKRKSWKYNNSKYYKEHGCEPNSFTDLDRMDDDDAKKDQIMMDWEIIHQLRDQS